jgi:phosphatidylglycerophosphate synthase
MLSTPASAPCWGWPADVMGSLVSPDVRARVRAGAEPVARLFGRLGLTPNALTLIGFGIAVVAAWQAAVGAWLAAGLLVAFGAIFDLFDGALARATGRTSRFGAFMDSTFDRAGEAVVYIGIAAGLGAVQGAISVSPLILDGVIGPIAAVSALAAAFMVSYTRAKSESLGLTSGSGMANIGLAPREVRTVILVLALLVAGTFGMSFLTAMPAGATPVPPMWWFVLVGALALITVLAAITTIQRIVHVYLQSQKEP